MENSGEFTWLTKTETLNKRTENMEYYFYLIQNFLFDVF